MGAAAINNSPLFFYPDSTKTNVLKLVPKVVDKAPDNCYI